MVSPEDQQGASEPDQEGDVGMAVPLNAALESGDIARIMTLLGAMAPRSQDGAGR